MSTQFLFSYYLIQSLIFSIQMAFFFPKILMCFQQPIPFIVHIQIHYE